MSHSIFGTRFVGMREPAWHELGTVLDEQVTAREALTVAGIDYDYLSVPVGYTLPDGTFVEDPTRVAVLRAPTHDDPTYRSLGFASDKYAYLQNAELADGLDALAAKTGWAFETAGALDSGGRVFMTLKAGTRSVLGDEYQQYFVVSDGKVAGRALQISLAPVRVVCQNTLMMADAQATEMIRLPHNRDVASDYAFWTNLTAGLEKAREASFLRLEQMAASRITDDQARSIIAAAYPLPNKNARARQHEAVSLADDLDPETREAALSALSSGVDSYEARLARQTAHRDAAFDLYVRFNDGAEQASSAGTMPTAVRSRVAGTAYAALQAVTELADWSGTGSQVVAAHSALFGSRSRVKVRAWRAASALTPFTSPSESPVALESEDLLASVA